MNDTHHQLLKGETNVQIGSPLFSVLPAEIRNEIFAYVLTDFPDPNPDAAFSAKTIYARPSYFAPRKSDTTVLRTCRAIYREAWHLPFLHREQIHWLTHKDRAPPGYSGHTHGNLRSTLKQIAELQGEDHVVIDRLRVFAQMWRLEGGGLAELLRTPFLRPRILTLTIRHTDWWYWESDEPLRFEARWIEQVCKDLPSSVREFRVELESLDRKKEQVDQIAAMMAANWFFCRKDGVVLLADAGGKTHEVSRWSGSSIWQGSRWVRDEADAEEKRIDYYVLTVVFRPEEEIKWKGGEVSPTARAAGTAGVFDEAKMACHLPPTTKQLWGVTPSIDVSDDEYDDHEYVHDYDEWHWTDETYQHDEDEMD